MGSYRVVGPLVVARDADGKQQYLYEGAVLPDSIPAEEAERLVATGLVAEADAGEEKPPKQSAAAKKAADAKAAADEKAAADAKAAADTAAAKADAKA